MRKFAATILLGALVAWMPGANEAHANGVMNTFTLHFDNLDRDLGLNSQIDIDNQYLSMWGVRFNRVYRYIDERDPFVDPGEIPGGLNFGISNGWVVEREMLATNGRIHFEYGNTPYFTFDWWTIAEDSMTVRAFNAAGDLQDEFLFDGAGGPGFGTETLNGDIASVVFYDAGGFVQIANMTYESAIPEPGTLGLVGLGLAGWAAARRRKRTG